MSSDELQQLAIEVKNFNATVFVVFISASHLLPFAEELSKLNVSDKIWIASEAWATSTTIRDVDGNIFTY